MEDHQVKCISVFPIKANDAVNTNWHGFESLEYMKATIKYARLHVLSLHL